MNATELLLHDERRKNGKYYISSALVTDPYLAPLQCKPNTNGYSRTAPSAWPSNSSYTTGTNSDFYDIDNNNSASLRTLRHGPLNKSPHQSINTINNGNIDNKDNYNTDKLSDLQNELIQTGKLFLSDGRATNKLTNNHISSKISDAYMNQKNIMHNDVNSMNQNISSDINMNRKQLIKRSSSRGESRNPNYSDHDHKKIILYENMSKSMRYKKHADDFDIFADIPEYTKGNLQY
jgi:hypothetical protein